LQDGLKQSRAYDLLKLAGGRTTDEELRKETRDRVEKHRAKKKLSKPDSVTEPQAEPCPELSVTSPPVTESVEQAAEEPQPEPSDEPDDDEPDSPLGHLSSTVPGLKVAIEALSYELARELLLWLTDHLIAIRPEHGAATQKKAA
jgi:hypothetical protein